MHEALELRIGSHTVLTVKTPKILGVHFDPMLIFTNHAKQIPRLRIKGRSLRHKKELPDLFLITLHLYGHYNSSIRIKLIYKYRELPRFDIWLMHEDHIDKKSTGGASVLTNQYINGD